MADEKREVVTVICAVPNGVRLRLCRSHEGAMVPYGESVILAGPQPSAAGVAMTTEPVLNTDIDRGFLTEWLKQNARNSLVTSGMIRIDGEQNPEPPVESKKKARTK